MISLWNWYITVHSFKENKISKILININKPVHTIKWSKREPIAVREAHYQEVRNRIFGKHDPDRNISPKIARARRRSQQRKAERRMICSAIRAAVEGDNRPFAQVKIEDLDVVGLLDSGASVSLLGEGCLETVERLGLIIERSQSIMKSAGGTQHRGVGKIQPNISYNGVTHRLPILLCPSLKQKLYLGIDFWRRFELAPEVVGVEFLH